MCGNYNGDAGDDMTLQGTNGMTTEDALVFALHNANDESAADPEEVEHGTANAGEIFRR